MWKTCDEQPSVSLTHRAELAVGGTSLIYRRVYSNGWREIEKILIPKYQGSLEYEALIEKEYELLREIQHPFIVRPLRIETRRALAQGSTSALFMENVEGCPLSQVIPFLESLDSPTRKSWAREFLAQFVSALNHLKEKEIIHGDIAPENILIQPSGYIKLIDFGVARHISDKPHEFRIEGRAYYRAPEVKENGYGSIASDIYSAGKIFEEVVGTRLENDLDIQPLLDQLINERKLPELSSPFLLMGLKPLPPRDQLHQKVKIRQKTRIIKDEPWIPRPILYYGFLLLMTPFITSFLPQTAELTVNTLPWSHFIVSSLERNVLYETPVRNLKIPSGKFTLHFIIPSQGNRQIIRKVHAAPGEHLKVFEDYRIPDILEE